MAWKLETFAVTAVARVKRCPLGNRNETPALRLGDADRPDRGALRQRFPPHSVGVPDTPRMSSLAALVAAGLVHA